MVTERPPITALVIPAGEGEPARLAPITADLETMQGLVGGWLEALSLGQGAVMYLNEEGKILGLPLNTAANRIVALANPGLAPGDFIVGQVIILGDTAPDGTEDGAEHDVPASALEWCRLAGVKIDTTPNPDQTT